MGDSFGVCTVCRERISREMRVRDEKVNTARGPGFNLVADSAAPTVMPLGRSRRVDESRSRLLVNNHSDDF